MAVNGILGIKLGMTQVFADDGYVVLFAQLTKIEADFKCRVIAKEIGAKLLGSDWDRLAAGTLWHDHGLVFASVIGTPLDAANVRREFRKITEAAGLGFFGDETSTGTGSTPPEEKPISKGWLMVVELEHGMSAAKGAEGAVKLLKSSLKASGGVIVTPRDGTGKPPLVPPITTVWKLTVTSPAGRYRLFDPGIGTSP